MGVEAENRAAEASRGGLSVSQQALETQTALLPYAIGVFIISLPAYVWVGSYADSPVWMTSTFATFAGAWAVFYGVVNWLKRVEGVDIMDRNTNFNPFKVSSV